MIPTIDPSFRDRARIIKSNPIKHKYNARSLKQPYPRAIDGNNYKPCQKKIFHRKGYANEPIEPNHNGRSTDINDR